MKKYTTEQRNKIISRAKSIGISAAAKENNVPYSTIQKWLKDEGILVRETLINSALPVHANRHLLYNRHIKNTGEKPHESTIL